ncbi:MAG: MFS transporter, partial [Methanobacterium paludis]|nr:MFS transporter [Methanobacterium paludis]
MNKEKLWTKDFITMSVINFLIALIFYLLLVTIAVYAITKFHASTDVAGLVSGIFIIGSLFGRLGTGRIIDNIGNKKVLIVSVIFFTITSALYLVANSLPLLILNRVLQGIAFGIATTTLGTVIAQIIPVSRRGEGIGYFSMSTIIATAIGPFLGILLIKYANFDMIFIFNLVLAIFCLLISLAVNEPAHKLPKPDKIKGAKSFQIRNYLEFTAIPISIIALIISFAYSGVLTFISLYAEQIHLVEAASFFFIVYAIIVLVTRPFSGRLLDDKGANIVMYPCFFIFAIAMLLFSQANLGITLLLAGALFGLGFGNLQSCGQAIAIKVAPSHKLGLATATYYMFYDMGFGVGPYLFGFLIPFTGYRGLY